VPIASKPTARTSWILAAKTLHRCSHASSSRRSRLRGSLPTHDFVPNPDTDLNSEDVANVILRDDPVPQLIDWDVCTCIEMYKLATVMKSPAVQDMVADKIRTIYLAHCKEGTESGFDFPLDFLNSLTPDQDAPLLRLIVDILLDRSRK
jgi:hypothetical protein